MKTSTLVIAGVGIGAYLILSHTGALRRTIKQLEVQVTMPTGFKKDGMMIRIPVAVHIKNFQNGTLKVDSLKVIAEREEAPDKWVPFAVNSPLSNINILPYSDTKLSVEMTASVLGILADLFTMVPNIRKNKIRFVAIPTVMGVIADPIVSTTYTV